MTGTLWPYPALVTEVHDGDTLYVTRALGGGVLKTETVRLQRLNAGALIGIDCPENTTPLGKQATAMVKGLILPGARITVTGLRVGFADDKMDKYGRLLAAVTYGDNLDLGTVLKDAGLARDYSGEGPKPW